MYSRIKDFDGYCSHCSQDTYRASSTSHVFIYRIYCILSSNSPVLSLHPRTLFLSLLLLTLPYSSLLSSSFLACSTLFLFSLLQFHCLRCQGYVQVFSVPAVKRFLSDEHHWRIDTDVTQQALLLCFASVCVIVFFFVYCLGNLWRQMNLPFLSPKLEPVVCVFKICWLFVVFETCLKIPAIFRSYWVVPFLLKHQTLLTTLSSRWTVLSIITYLASMFIVFSVYAIRLVLMYQSTICKFDFCPYNQNKVVVEFEHLSHISPLPPSAVSLANTPLLSCVRVCVFHFLWMPIYCIPFVSRLYERNYIVEWCVGIGWLSVASRSLA